MDKLIDGINGNNIGQMAYNTIISYVAIFTIRQNSLRPQRPWGNGCNESFNGRLRDGFLTGEMFYSLKEAKIMIEKWRVRYNITAKNHIQA